MNLLAVEIRHRYRAAKTSGFTLDAVFTSPLPGTVALFGASGSGKSTIAAAIAGLLRPDAGRITIGDAVLFDAANNMFVPPNRRGLGVVFQDARLFPHMGVAANLRYGERRAKTRGIGFDDVVDLLGLAHLLARAPRDLSGGERQRVAIGRALLAQPRLLLMDEPLASLDQDRKREILPYLARLKSALDLPIVYITHSPDEVARLADTLVLIEGGRVVASGPVGEIAARGDLAFARRDDAAAILSMRVASHDPDRRLTLLEAGKIRLWIPLANAVPGAALRVSVPAREVILATSAPDGISLHNVIPCDVRAVRDDAGRHASLIELDAGALRLLARVTPDAVQRLGLAPGRPALALVKSTSVDVLG